MQRSNLERTITKSCAEMDLPECLLHGHPIGRNVFLRTEEGKGLTVIALIDWTRKHSNQIANYCNSKRLIAVALARIWPNVFAGIWRKKIEPNPYYFDCSNTTTISC